MSRREPEGYLFCLNVPVARTGTQEYLPEELEVSGSGMISVFRPESEVFAPETIASFEGMPVTNDHPPDGVDIENIRRLQRGHAHNVRRGTGSESDLLLADLIITDPALIDAILVAGKREISCGYDYQLCEEEGRYVQRKIRGNHIAVVDAGRAGPRVSIKDRQPPRCPVCHPERSGGSSSVSDTTHSERRKTMMKKNVSKTLVRVARDFDEETAVRVIGEMIGENVPEESAEEPVTVEVPENREITVDGEEITGLLQRVNRMIDLLAAALAPAAPAAEDGDPEELGEALGEILEAAAGTEAPSRAEEIEEIVEEALEPEVSVTLEESGNGGDCGRQECISVKDALRAVALGVRPVLEGMSAGDRFRACANITARMKRVRKARDGRIYNAMESAGRPGAAGNLADLGRRIMASRNVNYKKKGE